MMPGQVNIFLDVETDWDRCLTLVGFHSSASGTVQLVGGEITAARLRKELPKAGRLYTYNGHSFDLPVIHKQLGLYLRSLYDSHDLRWICQRHGLTGGQKAIELRLGVCRQAQGVDGLEAIALWNRYQRGDRTALQTLLRYNREDLAGLTAIRKHLHRHGLLTR
jgi:uncharacterized protein YprB with RNaseH-like and TPR domain